MSPPIDPDDAEHIRRLGDHQGLSEALDPELRLQRIFPRLAPGTYKIIGNATPRYNCIAWAAGKKDAFWWPGNPALSFWPPGLPTDPTLDTFLQLFQTLGYETCTDEVFHRRFEKIAIFVKDGEVTHAARQRGSGRWSSKLGNLELIEHDLDAIAGHSSGEYGDIRQIMRRKRGLRRIVLEAVYEIGASWLD
jgi:hypothetical protein